MISRWREPERRRCSASASSVQLTDESSGSGYRVGVMTNNSLHSCLAVAAADADVDVQRIAIA